MLQIEDALDEFKTALKNIKKDKGYSADKAKAKIVADLDSANDDLEKLAKKKAELQKCISEVSKLKDDVKKYNDAQHALMATIKSIGASAANVSDDTKTKDFAAIADDAKQLQALNDLDGPVFPKG